MADPGGGCDRDDHTPPSLSPPPPLNFPDTENLCKVCVTGTDHPPPWNVDDVTRAMSKGGACECPRVGYRCFSIFRRADDVTRTMSKGGVLVNVFTPPFRISCIRAWIGTPPGAYPGFSERGGPRSTKEANKPNKRATELKPRTCAHQGSIFRPYSCLFC